MTAENKGNCLIQETAKPLGIEGSLWRKWIGLGTEEKHQGNKYITIGTGIIPPCHNITPQCGLRNKSVLSKLILFKSILQSEGVERNIILTKM